MNTAEPSKVATKQPGRTSATSVMVAMDRSSAARLTLRLPKLMTVTHRPVINFVFIKKHSQIAALQTLRLGAGLFK
jgi:hypothetical protein